MTLREVLENIENEESLDESILSQDFYNSFVNSGGTQLAVIGLQALSAVALAGLVKLLVNLYDKTSTAIVKKKAKKALAALDIKDEDREHIDAIAKQPSYSVKEKMAAIREILEKYRK